MAETSNEAATHRSVLRGEIRDFLRFVRRPTLGPRLPRPAMPVLAGDWIGSIDLRRIMRWVLLLWAFNFLVLGPLAAAAAWMGGASHRLNPMALPWFLALVWAPVIEELMFRLGMRRPGAALWLIPAFVLIGMYGQDTAVGTFLAISLALVALPRPEFIRRGSKGRKPRGSDGADALPVADGAGDERFGGVVRNRAGSDTYYVHQVIVSPATARRQPLLPGVSWRFRWNRRYRRAFPLVFHLLTVAFAVLHLLNFSLAAMSWWLLPLLVLPQWVTGLVLGWMRVRAGIGASMLMHALFNAGPLMVVWLMMRAGV